jgi:hypothetical protein
MFRIFDPIIREIDRLVAEQVTKVRMERLELGNSNRAAVKVGLHGAILQVLLNKTDRYSAGNLLGRRFWIQCLSQGSS